MLEKYKAQEVLARVQENLQLHELNDVSAKLQVAALGGKKQVSLTTRKPLSTEFLQELANGGIESTYDGFNHLTTFYFTFLNVKPNE